MFKASAVLFVDSLTEHVEYVSAWLHAHLLKSNIGHCNTVDSGRKQSTHSAASSSLHRRCAFHSQFLTCLVKQTETEKLKY